MANFSTIFAGVVDTGGKLATGVNDTGGKFATSVNSTTQRCPNKIIKIFLLEGFFYLPPVSLTPVEYLREFSKKFETALML